MTEKRLRIWTAAISGVLALVVSWAIVAGNIVVPFFAILVALGLSFFLRRKVKTVTQDERTTLLYEKAAGVTLRFCVPAAALAGIVLFALRDRLSVELVSAGYALAYVSCVLLLVHSALYSYYSRKH
jgi:uncharacterized membrane protein